MSLHRNSSGRGIHQPGQYQVSNVTGLTIVKGTVVQITGLDGFMTVAPVNNPASNNVLGLVVDDIDNGESGYVARMGLFGQFDTSSFSVGDQLYSDGSGVLTTTELGPKIGLVLSVSATDGQIHMDVHDASGAVGGSGGHEVLVTTLVQADIDNGFILLPLAPSTPSATLVLLKGAPAQVYGDDFTVSGNTLTFINSTAGDLGDILTAGDKLTIMYK